MKGDVPKQKQTVKLTAFRASRRRRQDGGDRENLLLKWRRKRLA